MLNPPEYSPMKTAVIKSREEISEHIRAARTAIEENNGEKYSINVVEALTNMLEMIGYYQERGDTSRGKEELSEQDLLEIREELLDGLED